MTKLAYRFTDKKGKGIESWSLHKAPKGEYKHDVIELDFLKVGGVWDKGMVMTPKEAVVMANALLLAVVIHEERKSKKRVKKKRKRER